MLGEEIDEMSNRYVLLFCALVVIRGCLLVYIDWIDRLLGTIANSSSRSVSSLALGLLR